MRTCGWVDSLPESFPGRKGYDGLFLPHGLGWRNYFDIKIIEAIT